MDATALGGGTATGCGIDATGGIDDAGFDDDDDDDAAATGDDGGDDATGATDCSVKPLVCFSYSLKSALFISINLELLSSINCLSTFLS